MAMTERATLEALLARVLEGEGPDRELDAEIARMMLPPDADTVTRSRYGWSYRVFGPDGWDDEWLENKPYTASLDAVLRDLLPEGWRVNTADWSIPGVYSWTLRGPCRKYVTGADGWDEAGDDWFRTASAATPLRALIAACIKARMEAQGE